MSSTQHRLSIHGLPAIIHCAVGSLDEMIRRTMAEFLVKVWPEKLVPCDGTIRPYNKDEVLKHLSNTAVRISGPRDPMELYQENERFWLIDDRWGLTEINLLKSQWRSWVLDDANLDVDRAFEMTLMWPAAQLLRARGLDLIPAATVNRNGWGLLILSPFNVEPELTALVKSGFRIVGQRWSALRDENSKITALHMPGQIERTVNLANGTGSSFINLEDEFVGSSADRGACDTIVLVEPGRRPTPYLRLIPASNALPALRRAWPIVELHPHRVHGQLPAKISRRCKVYTARLSRRPQDLLAMLEHAKQNDFNNLAERAALKHTAAAIQRQIEAQPARNIAV